MELRPYQQAAKAVIDDTNERARALQPAVAANGLATASVAAHLEALERIMAALDKMND